MEETSTTAFLASILLGFAILWFATWFSWMYCVIQNRRNLKEIFVCNECDELLCSCFDLQSTMMIHFKSRIGSTEIRFMILCVLYQIVWFCVAVVLLEMETVDVEENTKKYFEITASIAIFLIKSMLPTLLISVHFSILLTFVCIECSYSIRS